MLTADLVPSLRHNAHLTSPLPSYWCTSPATRVTRLARHVAYILLHILCMLHHAYEAWNLAPSDGPPYACTPAFTRVAQCFCSMKHSITLGSYRVVPSTRVLYPKEMLCQAYLDFVLSIAMRLVARQSAMRYFVPSARHALQHSRISVRAPTRTSGPL
jgi:hypothetical protein